jgi:cation diffusion facilitator CzcD-associated flavoprotein CzcO
VATPVTQEAAAERQLPDEVEVAIVGAGFGGLGTAISLRRAGIESFVVLERSGEVGGTWSANTYPGCQCDVPSNLYSFSFARKADWTHSYPEQPQILDYLHYCVRRFDLMPKIALNTALIDAKWDEDERRWQIETQGGSMRARFLVGATGLLSEPKIPDIPGADRFQGKSFHSARWDHSRDMRGRGVAVIGTGASAIQIVPRIQPEVDQLYVVQRTPPWIVPHPDREIGPRLRRVYQRVPLAQRIARYGVYWLRELLGCGFVGFKPVMWLTERNATKHLEEQVPDPELRAKLTPPYKIGCKRVLLSDEFYPALQEPNAELVTEQLTEIREHALVFGDGSEREVDTIIWGTGFSPTDPPLAHRIRDGGGRTLSEAWSESMRAYLGTTVAGFPNLFLLWGPNTNLAHSSIVFMIESQLNHVMGALRAARRGGVSRIEVRAEVERAWNDWLQSELRESIWNTGGCSSWYLDRNGNNTIMWPAQTFTFHRRLRRFDPAEYLLAA